MCTPPEFTYGASNVSVQYIERCSHRPGVKDLHAGVNCSARPLRYAVGSNSLVNGRGFSCRKYSSGVWNVKPTLAAKSLDIVSSVVQQMHP